VGALVNERSIVGIVRVVVLIRWLDCSILDKEGTDEKSEKGKWNVPYTGMRVARNAGM
jgi:hypothetical protein